MAEKKPNTQLRTARMNKNLTQKEVAEKIGTRDLSVGRWERGEASPTLYYRRKLCELFEMSSEDLGFTETDNQEAILTQEEQVLQRVDPVLDEYHGSSTQTPKTDNPPVPRHREKKAPIKLFIVLAVVVAAVIIFCSLAVYMISIYYSAPITIVTPPTGNIAYLATRNPADSNAAVDGSLNTEWVGGHQVPLVLSFNTPQKTQGIVVVDRKQHDPDDNNQINKVQILLDGVELGTFDMVSGGPRCVEVTFSSRSITSVKLIPVDASGNNGFSEIQIWNTSPQDSCSNKIAR